MSGEIIPESTLQEISRLWHAPGGLDELEKITADLQIQSAEVMRVIIRDAIRAYPPPIPRRRPFWERVMLRVKSRWWRFAGWLHDRMFRGYCDPW